jgi:hypothetical protein
MAIAARRIIVQFRPVEGTSLTLEQLCQRVASMATATLVRPPTATGRAVFMVETPSNLDALIEEIERLPFVEYAEPDVVDRISPSR